MAVATFDLSLALGDAILERVRDLNGFDSRNAILVDDPTQGPVAGMRTYQLHVVRPSINPRGYAGGAYAETVTIRFILFTSWAADRRRETSAAQAKLGEQCVRIRQQLEGHGLGVLNVALYGVSGPSELRWWQPEKGEMGLFFLEWYMRGERWLTLEAFRRLGC